MATVTGKQAVAGLRSIAQRVYVRAVDELPVIIIEEEAELKQNVFRFGKAADGKPIGKYSTKPFYADLDQLKEQYGSQIPLNKLKPRGKAPAGKKRGYTARKLFGEVVPLVSKYFPGGYKEFRGALGRETEFVNLKLSGNLEKSIASGHSGNKATISFKNPEQATIARDHEKKYAASIFAVGKVRVTAVFDRLNKLALEVLREATG